MPNRMLQIPLPDLDGETAFEFIRLLDKIFVEFSFAYVEEIALIDKTDEMPDVEPNTQIDFPF